MVTSARPCESHRCDGCWTCRKKGTCCGRDRADYVPPAAGSWPGRIVGQLGIIGRHEDGRLLCHVCGEPSHNLGAHGRSHGIAPSEYKAYFGLTSEQSLLSARLLSSRAKPRNKGPVLSRRVYRTCVVCGKTMEWKRPDSRKACSPECVRQLLSAANHGRKDPRKGIPNPRYEKRCSVCGHVITRRFPNSRGIPRTCSAACAKEATRQATMRRHRRATIV